MPTIFLYLLTILTYLNVRVDCQDNVLSYELLSDGQKIVVPLQQYFSNASSAQINDEKSTNKYDDKFTVFNTSDKPYRTAFDQQLSFLYKGKIISFRNLQSYSSKSSLYNQPIKLYLLTSNFLMMVIYNEHCGDYNENKVIGINLTQSMPDNYKVYKNITCTSMETITTNEQEFQDLAYVVCRGLEQTRDNKYYSYFVVKVLLTHNDQGFIQGFKIVNYTLVAFRSQSCLEYALKLFQTLRVGNSIVPQRIWLFCRQKNSFPIEQELIRYFYDIQDGLSTMLYRNLTDCLVNSKYISANGDGGFISVINQKVYEYYTNTTKSESMCVATSLDKIDYEFAANRNYNNIQITYFFLKNATIIIKSSYRTNHQILDLNKTGFSFTSYAITEHYMSVSLCNNLGTTIMLVYEMEDLFPKLIDERIVQTNQTCNNFVLTSTNNYLEKGYYIFFYNKTTNILSLKEYTGYILVIKPKPQKFSQTNNEILPYQHENGKIIQVENLLMKRQNSNVYVFYIEMLNSNQNLTIKLTIRRFNNSNIQFLPYKKLNFDSPYVNLDLSTVAIGPLQRFYIDDTLTDKNVKLKFINYYSTINISNILQKKNSAGKIQLLKQLALNIQLKVINPVLTLYFSTFIQNCNIKYDKNNEFTIDCLNQNVIKIKNSSQSNQNKIIVLTKDKWLQYSNKTIQYCYILGDSGQCEQLPFIQKNPLDVEIQIRKIKLIRFQQKSHSTYIELFVIYMRGYSSELAYGYFNKQQSSSQFKWTKIFIITPKQVSQLSYMELTNVHFDKNYNHYLLLHLSTDQTILKHIALLYDRPGKIDNGYFLGHLIERFDDNTIQSILTIGNFLIIIRRFEDQQAQINQFQITEFYSVLPTRTYPLYGRKIIKNGSHIADGQFLYIQVSIQNGQSEGKTEYVVYCPSLKTTNILTHTLPKSEVPLLFVQQIGSIVNNKYPHSIGINGKDLFALSIPNLVVKFEYDSKKQNKNMIKRTQMVRNKDNELTSVQKIFIPGNFSLRLIDYQNIMYAFNYEYEFNISNQAIEYNESSISLNISQQNSNSSYSLKIDQIKGPVMEIDMKVNSQCPFIKKNIQSEDIFTQLQCLSQIDSKKYGTILDLKSLKVFNQNSSIDIIITTQHFLCVQNHQIQYSFNITYRACLIVSYNNSNGKGIFVCDNGQGSVINTFSFSLSSSFQICQKILVNQNITKPSWLIYQYFKMRYIHPYAIFEVPIRIEANKIYFLTKFDIFTTKFIDRYQSLIYNNTNQIDHFLTKDFQVDEIYAYLLQDGLGIYDLDNIQVVNQSISQPLAWIPSKNITQTLGSSSELVYIKPDEEPKNSQQFNCSIKFNKKIFMEIGTISRAYKVKICFNDDDDAVNHRKNKRREGKTSKIQQFQMTVLIQYNQYKDCKNTVLSKSKSWQNLTMKLCALQIQQHRIFSNYMPITPRTSQYYMQFYSVKQNVLQQKIDPFRMQKISTNDTIQINLFEGQLLVKSLFSFLCYYKLATEIKWTIFRDDYDNETSDIDKPCTANIVFSNQNFQRVVSIRINNNDLQLEYHYQPWIYRCFFLFISLISMIKLRMFLLHKNIKFNKLKFNLLSNEFEFNVRMNSKKQIEQNLLERGQSQQQLNDNSFHKYQH